MDLLDPTKNEIKAVKKLFKNLDDLVEKYDEKEIEKNPEERKKAEQNYMQKLIKIGHPLFDLMSYEVTYDSFKKYIKNEKYLMILKDAYNHESDFINSAKNFFRLLDKPIGGRRAAMKQLEKMVKGQKKEQTLVANLLFSKEVNKASQEFTYEFRDWLINDFDDLIDIIEPVRQEYIISKRGDVEPEEVEKFLSDKFEEYQVYKQWITDRQNFAFVYYPDLKIK